MVKRKLKSFVIPSIAVFLIIVGAFISIVNMKDTGKDEELSNVDFVTNIFSSSHLCTK